MKIIIELFCFKEKIICHFWINEFIKIRIFSKKILVLENFIIVSLTFNNKNIIFLFMQIFVAVILIVWSFVTQAIIKILIGFTSLILVDNDFLDTCSSYSFYVWIIDFLSENRIWRTFYIFWIHFHFQWFFTFWFFKIILKMNWIL